MTVSERLAEPVHADDGRITFGLLFEVYDVLRRAGFIRPADADVGTHADALLALRRLTQAYEGQPFG